MTKWFTKSALLGLLTAGYIQQIVASPVVMSRQDNTTSQGTCTSLNQRKSWTALTDNEKNAYIDAELCLMSSPPKLGIEGALNRWDEVQYSHLVQSNVIHDVGAFLPWHRLYMRAHEILLQTECNYTGAQPYWDEQAEVAAIEAGNHTYAESAVFDPDTGLGGNGSATDNQCVTDGPFANLTLHLNQTTSYTSYCLSRDLSVTSIETGNQSNVDTCFASEDYAAAWLCYKAKPHTAGHAGIAGTMLSAAGSPGDPFFFLHHTNLDRLWWEWQQVNLTSRLTDMGGRNIPLLSFLEENDFVYPSASVLDYDGDNGGNVTTLNHNLWMVGLIANATIGNVMDLGGETICAEYV